MYDPLQACLGDGGANFDAGDTATRDHTPGAPPAPSGGRQPAATDAAACALLPGLDPARFSQPLVPLGQLCAQPGPGCIDGDSLRDTGVTVDELSRLPAVRELIESHAVVHLSKVDVDNDGSLEVQVLGYVGSAHCARSSFYKARPDHPLQLIAAPGFDIFAEEGRFCVGDEGYFVRVDQRNFFVEQTAARRDMYALSPAGMTKICSSRVPDTPDEKTRR